jgi:hypothetical protein
LNRDRQEPACTRGAQRFRSQTATLFISLDVELCMLSRFDALALLLTGARDITRLRYSPVVQCATAIAAADIYDREKVSLCLLSNTSPTTEINDAYVYILVYPECPGSSQFLRTALA